MDKIRNNNSALRTLLFITGSLLAVALIALVIIYVTGKVNDVRSERIENYNIERETINPFEYVNVYFSGENGFGSVYISSRDSRFSEAYYTLKGLNGNLRNGDTVEIEFSDEFETYHPEYKVLSRTGQYIVSGLTDYSATYVAPTSTYTPYYDRTVPDDLWVQGSENGYILPLSDQIEYDESFLSTFTDKQLRYARNEVSARNGRMYKDTDLQNYFNTRWWYRPQYDPDYFDKNIYGKMNHFELYNMSLINKIEAARKK